MKTAIVEFDNKVQLSTNLIPARGLKHLDELTTEEELLKIETFHEPNPRKGTETIF